MNYKRKANIALVISFIFFCICIILRYFYREIYIFKLMLFVSEASLVGGIADWFAVTALFTKPFGFPFHTAIIPRNRKSIINSTVNLVETDLLSKETLKNQMDNLSVVEHIIRYVDDDETIKSKYINKLTKMVMNYIYEKDLKEVVVYIENIIKEEGKNINLLNKFKDFIENKFRYENRVKWAQNFLNKLSEEEGNEKILAFSQKIFTASEEGSSFSLRSLLNKLNVLVAEDLSAIIKSQLQNILTDLMKEDSLLSQVCANNIIKSIEGVELSPALIEEWKLNLLEKTDFKPIIEAQLPLLIKETTISDIVEKLWDYFKENITIKNTIDKVIKEIIYNLLGKTQCSRKYCKRYLKQLYR